MISLYTGLPGAGKSLYVVGQVILPALRSDRRVWAVMDLEPVDVWRRFLGDASPDLQSKLLVREDLSFLKEVGPGDVVVIDECQRWLRSGGTPDKDVLYWFETHRHLGCDVALITQDYMKIFRQVYILAELVYTFRKLSFLGLHGSTRLTVKGGVKEEDVIRKETVNFDPAHFQLYRSYDSGKVKEVRSSSGSIWRSWVVRSGVAALVFLVWFLSSRPWLSASSPPAAVQSAAPEQVAGRLPVAGGEVHLTAEVSVKPVICIIGSVGGEDGTDYWFLASDGRRYSLDELRGKLGRTIWKRDGRNGWRLFAEGLEYAGMGCDSDSIDH